VCKQVQEGVKRYQVLVAVVGATLCGQDDSSGDELASPGTLTYIGGMYNTPGQEAFLKDAVANSPGKHQALALLGPEEFGSTKAWNAAEKSVLPDNPDFEITREVYTDFSTPDAYKKVQDALQGAPDIDVIISVQGDSSKGAVQAIKQLGREGDVRIYEMGGSKNSVALVKGGDVYSTFPTYPRSAANAAVVALVKASKGEDIPRFIDRDGNATGVLKGISADQLSGYTPEW
jgi:ribose transport system substrate-binding protein